MIVVRRLIEHRFALEPPMKSAAGSWHERHSLLVVVETAQGELGLGEAAPLPGYSRDTLTAARDALLPLLGCPLPVREPAGDTSERLRSASASLSSPAARAALEAALLDVWSRQEGCPAWSLLRPGAAGVRVPLSEWLPDGSEAALEAALGAARRGITAFKVKLDARQGLEDGIRTLEALRRAFGAAISLRADANRSATRGELAPYAERLRALALEWLEEPTAEPLVESLGVPVALDESLEPAGAGPELVRRPFVAALVLKPTALGGIVRCLELARRARESERTAVASHTLEGPVGFAAAAALAVTLGADRAHGLAPHRALRSGRPPALAPDRDELVAWQPHGLGVSIEDALAGAEVVREHRA